MWKMDNDTPDLFFYLWHGCLDFNYEWFARTLHLIAMCNGEGLWNGDGTFCFHFKWDKCSYGVFNLKKKYCQM